MEWTDFERGFASTVRVSDPLTLRKQASAITAAAPVRRVWLDWIGENRRRRPDRGLPWLRALRFSGWFWPWLGGTPPVISIPRELEVVDLEIDDRQAWLDRRTGDAPLTHLRVKGSFVSGLVAERLAASEVAASLERLELVGLSPFLLGARGAQTLASARLLHLAALGIDHQDVASQGLSDLVASLPALRELSARVCGVTEVSCFEHSEGAPIVHLDLSFNRFGTSGLRALMRSPRLAALESLALRYCRFDTGSVAAIVGAPCWSTLRTLDLSQNTLDADDMATLAAAPQPARLHTLRLADASLTRAAAVLLARVEWLPSLLVLDVSDKKLGPEDAAAIAEHLREIPGVARAHAEQTRP